MTEPAYLWNEEIQRVAMNTWRFRPAHDFTRFRYLIVHTTDPKLALAAELALAPEGRAIGASGEFVLFESTLEVVPILSPDVPLPVPAPPTLRKRVRDLLDRVRRERESAAPAPPGDDEPADPGDGPPPIPGHE